MISNNTLKIAVEALKLSSDYVINFYNKKINFKVKSKFSRDIVSDVDINSEKIIFTHLIKKFNKHNFILEERENIDNNSNFTWYIDPLDGTVNFSKGLEIFSISISLVHNNKFILGAVSIPFKNDLFYSHKGKTFKNGIILKCSNTTNIKKSLNVFDRIIVATTDNVNKNYHFSIDDRLNIINISLFKDLKFKKNKIKVVSFDDLTIDLCKKYKANTIIRGLRAASDFEYEFQLAGMNKKLNSKIETMFLMSDVENQIISSKFVKEIASLGGNIDRFVTRSTVKMLKNKI